MCIHLSSKVDIFMNLGMEDAGPLCTVNKLPKLVVCLGQTTNTISQKYNLKLINQQGILIFWWHDKTGVGFWHLALSDHNPPFLFESLSLFFFIPSLFKANTVGIESLKSLLLPFIIPNNIPLCFGAFQCPFQTYFW